MSHVKHVAKKSFLVFILTFIGVSVVGGYIGVRGNRVRYTTKPSQPYEGVSFPSQARDQLTLSGWYLPGTLDKTVVLVHGWGGHRGRTLAFTEYLQRSGFNVLTFDLRGGTGHNSYGQRESGDLAGAVAWLSTVKKVRPENLTVIGLSMGGAASAIYAADFPIGNLVLLSPVVDIKAVKQFALKNRHFILPNLYASGATFVEQVVFNVRPVNPITVYHKITVPTLIMHSDNDELSPSASLYALKDQTEARNQTNIQFSFLGPVGHTFLDTDEALGFPYAQQIVRFIKAN